MHHVVMALSMDRGLGSAHGNGKRLSFRKGKCVSELEIQRKNHHTYRNGGNIKNRVMKCVWDEKTT
jgi:hypothetical protein